MNQGKKQQQIDDSEGIITFAIVGFIITLITVIIQNLIS